MEKRVKGGGSGMAEGGGEEIFLGGGGIGYLSWASIL